MTHAPCSTPKKQRFVSWNSARKAAVGRVMREYEAGKPQSPYFGYRHDCGGIHLTGRAGWDGQDHPLMARVRPTRLIVERAHQLGQRSANEASTQMRRNHLSRRLRLIALSVRPLNGSERSTVHEAADNLIQGCGGKADA